MNLRELPAHQLQILLKVLVAFILGALIGLEREAAEKPAGLRTHMLVTGASALLVSLGSVAIDSYISQFGTTVIRSDPIRIIGAVVTGVSFLGAGTIIRLRSDGDIEGLTTAASLLLASAVGIGVALSQWFLVIGVTFLVLVILRGIPLIRRLLLRRWR